MAIAHFTDTTRYIRALLALTSTSPQSPQRQRTSRLFAANVFIIIMRFSIASAALFVAAICVTSGIAAPVVVSTVDRPRITIQLLIYLRKFQEAKAYRNQDWKRTPEAEVYRNKDWKRTAEAEVYRNKDWKREAEPVYRNKDWKRTAEAEVYRNKDWKREFEAAN